MYLLLFAVYFKYLYISAGLVIHTHHWIYNTLYIGILTKLSFLQKNSEDVDKPFMYLAEQFYQLCEENEKAKTM